MDDIDLTDLILGLAILVLFLTLHHYELGDRK